MPPEGGQGLHLLELMVLVRFVDANPIQVPTTGIHFDTKLVASGTQVDSVFYRRPGLPAASAWDRQSAVSGRAACFFKR